nr:hypothetical protein [uncultured Fusobacterium sp.]
MYLKKFSEAQEKDYNYMLFIELGYISPDGDLKNLDVKAVTIQGYFETIKQIYDYIAEMEYEATDEKNGRYECEVSNIYDVSKKIYFIKNEGITINEVQDSDIVDRIVNKGPKELVEKNREYLLSRI